jgi:hypothetical protein
LVAGWLVAPAGKEKASTTPAVAPSLQLGEAAA